jgi:hypothetical protein
MFDIRYLGRHFLVHSTSHPATKGGPTDEGVFDQNKQGKRRQYTEARCMSKTNHNALINGEDLET